MPPGEARTVTILVTDMAGSTAFRSKWGDAEADGARRRHVATVRKAVAARSGEIVKGTGDGTLATFDSAAEAIGAAIAIQQRSIAERSEQHAPPIRIGLAAGEVTFEGGDCFGRPVIEASRLETQAVSNGILATKLVELLAAGRSEATFHDRGEADLKGFPEPVPISEVRFDIPDSAPVASDAPVPVTPSRLSPPGLAGHTITRPRTDNRLAAALQHRIAMVEAGAGYGKSTAAASYLLASDSPWCWFSCDRRVGQPVSLAAHLCGALAKILPGFGLDRWPETGPELARAFAEQVSLSIAEPPIMCVDDIHSLPGEVQASLLEIAATSAPLRWLLLSREPIALPAASARLDASAPVKEVDLAFDRTEVEQLLERISPGSASTMVEKIQAETEGWPAGIVLSVRGAVGSSRPTDTDAPFDYLAEEALGTLPDELVDSLERLSVPHRFSAKIAKALTGRGDAAELISHLVDGHLFTIPLDSEGVWFRFHHLFRTFLRQRLESRSDVVLADLHASLAEAWLDADEPEEAVRSFIAADDLESAARTLGPLFTTGTAGPEYAALRSLLEAIPTDIRRQHANLMLGEAAGHLSGGTFEKAFSDYERSLELLIAKGQSAQAAGVFFRYLATMMTGGGRLAARIEVAERVLPHLTGRGPAEAIAYVFAAPGYGHSARVDEAEALIDEALTRDDSGIVSAFATATRGYFVSFPRGYVDEAIALLDTAIAFGLDHADEDPFGLAPYAMGLRSALLPQVGRYEEALVQVDDIEVEWARRFGGSLLGIARTLRWWKLLSRVGRGEWEHAEAIAGDPSEVLAGPDDVWSYRLAALYARLASIRGDLGAIAPLVRHGMKGLAEEKRTMDGPMVLCDFAHAADTAGMHEQRRTFARDALSYARDTQQPYRVAQAALHCAACSNGDERDVHLVEALTLSRERDYSFLWTRHERRLAGPLLGRALQLDDWQGYAAQLTALAGREVARASAESAREYPRAATALVDALVRSPDPDLEAVRIATRGKINEPRIAKAIRAHSRPPLAFNGFGGLQVARAGQLLRATELDEGAPAALLLAYLVAAWPGSVSLKAARQVLGADGSDIYAATTGLVTAMDPWHASRDAPLIGRRGDALSLALDQRDRVEFGPLLAPEGWGEMNLGRMKEVERATAGAFIPEYASHGWAVETGKRLAAVRVEFMIAFAERQRAEGRASQAADVLADLAKEDPEREELHRRLMRCYVDAGEPARALRQYHTCRARLLREHGIEPSAETQALFGALM